MPANTRSRSYSSRRTSKKPYSRLLSASPTPSSPPTSPEQDDQECPSDHPGLPTYAEYKRIEAGYLASLSPRKRDKALITQAMFDKIWDVLHQPDACTIETPQFRFWVRKMFTLSRGGAHGADATDVDADTDGTDAADLELERTMGIFDPSSSSEYPAAVVLHENRPVAIVEQLYALFCYCHVRAGHGGRDKTCAVIREHYSWVPKELTAQFVKACPTCVAKRAGDAPAGSRSTITGKGNKRRAWSGRLAVSPPVAVAVSNGRASSGRTGHGHGHGHERLEDATSDTYLPSLATALSNDSLDDDANLDLAEPAPRTTSTDSGEDAHLPPALRPLRLSGPVLSANRDEDLFHCRIDPVLLSFSYPGTSGSSLFACASGADGPADGMMERYADQEECVERVSAGYRGPAFRPFDLLSNASTSRYGRYRGYGYSYDQEDSLASMLLPCSDETLSRFSILTDA